MLGDRAWDERVLPPRGDYRKLLSFQKAEVIYDITFRFRACNKTRRAVLRPRVCRLRHGVL